MLRRRRGCRSCATSLASAATPATSVPGCSPSRATARLTPREPAVRDLARFRGDADDFRAWLFTVARNRAIDAARASSARPVLLLPDLPEPATSTGSAEAQALERLSTQDALRLVATLPADQAELVALRVIAGLDVAAVASITGRSAGAVRVGVHRALKVLSTRLVVEVQ